MRTYNSKLYVAFTTQVWRMKDASYPADRAKTWDGSTVFYKVNANSGSNYIISMETHLGFLYMLSQNGHLHRTDGNNTFDIWSWDGQTVGTSLRSYDGRLFVATYEYGTDITVGVGVLYQFTGAAVTELKRWGNPAKTTRLGNMIVWSRKLYYGAGNLFDMEPGFGVAVYDSIEDGHSIWAECVATGTYGDRFAPKGTDWLVTDLFVFGAKMFVAVSGHGVFFTPVGPGDVSHADSRHTPRAGAASITNGGFIRSSMYDGGTPGLKKLWRKVTVYIDLPTNTSFRLYYNMDNTDTWTAVSAAATAGPSGANGQYVFYLNNVVGTRFRYKIMLNTTVNTVTPVLRGIIVAYLPVRFTPLHGTA